MAPPMLHAGDTPPGPRGRPVVGVFLEARRAPLEFFLEAMETYGDVVCMRFGPRRAYLVSHPSDVRHVLEDAQGLYAKGPTAARVRWLFGESLTTLDGARWRRQRRLMQPAFRPTALLRVPGIVTDTTARMLDRWRSVADRGEIVDVLREMTALTRSIIVQLVFGEAGETHGRALDDALEEATRLASRRVWSPFGSLDLPTPGLRRLRSAVREIEGAVRAAIARGREDATTAGPVLAAALDAHDAGRDDPMREGDLCHELKAVLFAGHTTSAAALSWTFYALATSAGAQSGVRAEIRDALGGRAPVVDDLPRLARLRRVIDEVLRLYPPTWMTARTPLRDDRIRGYPIPAGSIVLLSPFVTHRHPGIWPEPHRFDPDRFGPERPPPPAFAYFPFGAGPRSCIGARLASLEMQLVVAMAAQRYEVVLAPGASVAMDPGLTLRPKPGVPVVLRPVG